MTKESLAQTSSDITESLMNISRMMSQQVQQSEDTMSTLGEFTSLDCMQTGNIRLSNNGPRDCKTCTC